MFGIFAALVEFERELIRERTVAGLEAARARGRKGGRKFALSKAQVRLAQSAMAHRDTSVSELCRELGIRPVTLYRYSARRASCGSRAGRSSAPAPEDRAAGRAWRSRPAPRKSTALGPLSAPMKTTSRASVCTQARSSTARNGMFRAYSLWTQFPLARR